MKHGAIQDVHGIGYGTCEIDKGPMASLLKLCRSLVNWRLRLVPKVNLQTETHKSMGLYTYKYVRFSDGVIVFPPILQHRTMSEMCSNLGQPISGGFVSKNEEGVIECHGRSISLKLGSKPDDTEVLNDYLAS